MAQSVTFIWMAIVEEDAELRLGGPNHLVRPAYRAAPVGPEISVVRRDSRTVVSSTARFTAVFTAPASELLARFGADLTPDTHAALRDLGEDLATLLRFELP
jgi:hypothetical protein